MSMSRNDSKKTKSLLCIAHPDDEVLFFSGLVQRKKYDWDLVCVTDANADGKGLGRIEKLKESCEKLKIRNSIFLNYPDRFESRLDIEKLILDLKNVLSEKNYKYVYTHGPLGEYGHKHHQDTCYSMYRAAQSFKSQVLSVAYNVQSSLKSQQIVLTKKEYSLKIDLMWKLYSEETKALLHFLPATSFESFLRLNAKEVFEIFDFMNSKRELNIKNLEAYKWMAEYIQSRCYELKNRPF